MLQRYSDAEIFYGGTYHEKDMTHNVRTTYYTCFMYENGYKLRFDGTTYFNCAIKLFDSWTEVLGSP